MEPFSGPPEWIKARGVETVVLRDTIRHNPEIKTTDWLLNRGSVQAYEGLLCAADGSILEGLSTNFYGVMPTEAGLLQLRTAERGVLAGISRSIVLTVALDTVTLNGQPILYNELESLAEALLSSATRGIVPIKKIDSVELSAPGSVTKQLMDRYEQWVEKHLEPLLPEEASTD